MMKHEHVLILGKEVCEWTIEEFDDFRKMNDWEQAVYEAMDDIYGKNNGIDTLAQAFNQDFSDKWYAYRKHLILTEQLKAELATPVIIDGRSYKKLKVFNVYHLGWESDSKGFVVTDGYQKHFVLTNHGDPYLAKPQEIRNLMKNYLQTVDEMQHALGIVNETDDVKEIKHVKTII
jgi:hypothetical protein